MILFTVAAAAETTLTILQLATKTSQLRKRSIVSLAGAFLFTMLLFVRVLEWGPRFYSIAVFLLIAVIISLIRLIGPSKNQLASNRSQRLVPILFRWLGKMLLLILVCLPAILFPPYQTIQPDGPHRVSVYQTSLFDEERTDVYNDSGDPRPLNLAFWYPDDTDADQSNANPLIVFSHGGLGVKTSNESLYLELASHGYVVVSIDHTYQSFFTTDDRGKTHLIRMDYMRELQSENARLDPQRSYELYQKWLTIRTDDINFVINHILSERDQPNTKPVYLRIDPYKIGVMGHSLGGSAALAMGRIRDDVGAVIAMEAPLLWDIDGVASGQFIWSDEPYPVPVQIGRAHV